MVSFATERRSDVKYSFTEKWANWITAEPSTLTMESMLEHVDRTAFSGSSSRQSSWSTGIDSVSKSNARNSASSRNRSGREAAATHWKSRCANSQFCFPISSNIRSYVSSSVFGNSSRARRMRCRRQCRRDSSWQYTHLNLHHSRKRVLRRTRNHFLTCHQLSL